MELETEKKSKFKEGEIVYVTKEAIEEKLEMKSSLPKEFFVYDYPYVIKTIGSYGAIGEGSHNFRILVHGSTQFVHEDSFEKRLPLLTVPEEKQKEMRDQAVNVIALTRGLTGEPADDAIKMALKMAGCVMELTKGVAFEKVTDKKKNFSYTTMFEFAQFCGTHFRNLITRPDMWERSNSLHENIRENGRFYTEELFEIFCTEKFQKWLKEKHHYFMAENLRIEKEAELRKEFDQTL